MARQAARAPSRLLAIESMSAPLGNWPSIPVTVPTLSAAPIAPWVQAEVLR